MMILVIGGSGSGKSSYAEDLVLALSKKQNLRKYYIAAMQVSDSEARKKVENHRRMRSGKGFFTVEQQTDVDKALEKMETGGRIALVECISNLAANEMFSGEVPQTAEQVAGKIIKEMKALKAGLTHLVIVSNNLFEDGSVYDEATMEYIRAMGRVNRQLADMADRVEEVAAGIPIAIKGEKFLCGS